MDLSQNDIRTPRLFLRLMNKEIITDCLDGNLTTAAQLLGAKIPLELQDNLSSLKHGLKQLEEDPAYLPWSSRAIILADEKQMIGHVRFHSCPNPEYLRQYASGAAEFGYRIFSKYRGHGYAKEAVSGLLNWARSEFSILNFIAFVSPDNHASLNLIDGFGFTKVGELTDETGYKYVFLHTIG